VTRGERGARSRSPGPTSAELLTITGLSRHTAVASSALRRVQFIRMAQNAGLTLDDIGELLEPRRATAGCAAVRAILERRLEEIEAKIVQLDRLRSVLRSGLDCRPERASDRCRRLCAAAGAACACEGDCTD